MRHLRTNVRSAVALWGMLRVGLGATALLAPRPALAVWVGTVPDPAGAVLGRALGARDIALGAGTVVSAVTGRAPAAWILASGGADAIDLLATLACRSQLPRGRRELVMVASGGSALASAVFATCSGRSRIVRDGS